MKLYGKNPVIERIKANPNTIKKLFVKANSNLDQIKKLAKKNNISCAELNASKFATIAGAVNAVEKHK